MRIFILLLAVLAAGVAWALWQRVDLGLGRWASEPDSILAPQDAAEVLVRDEAVPVDAAPAPDLPDDAPAAVVVAEDEGSAEERSPEPAVPEPAVQDPATTAIDPVAETATADDSPAAGPEIEIVEVDPGEGAALAEPETPSPEAPEADLPEEAGPAVVPEALLPDPEEDSLPALGENAAIEEPEQGTAPATTDPALTDPALTEAPTDPANAIPPALAGATSPEPAPDPAPAPAPAREPDPPAAQAATRNPLPAEPLDPFDALAALAPDLAVLAPPSPQEEAFAAALPPEAETRRVSADRVNLRQGPGTNFATQGLLDEGTLVEVLEVEGGWTRIRTPSGQEGWVTARFLARDPG